MGDVTINPKQVKAIACLLSEPTHVAAAARAGISEKTLYLWLAEPTFQAAYQQARRDAVQAAMGHFQHAMSKAAQTLIALMDDEKPQIRLQAAKVITEVNLGWLKDEDMLRRLEALEAAHANT